MSIKMEKISIIIFALCVAIGHADINSRIVGGSIAPESEFTYIASLRYRKTNKHMCEAVIISKEFLLTACQCVVDILPSELSVVVGTKSLKQGGVTHNVSISKCHEDYKHADRPPQNDIALLKLDVPLKLNRKVRTISVETQDELGPSSALVSGWGSESLKGDLPDLLRFARLKTVSNSECNKLLKGNVEATNICTLTGKNHGLCKGDAGAPLVIWGNLVGLASWGVPCGNDAPDVYTRVSAFVAWIFGSIERL